MKESKAEEQRGLQAARTQSWLADPSDRLQWELSHGGYLSRGKSPRLGPVPERQENPQKYKESPRAVASLDKTKLNSEGAKHNLHQINDTQTNEDHGLTASRPDKPPSKVSQANAEAATSTSTGANYVDTRAQRTLFIKGITDIIMHGAVIKYIITTAVHDPTVEEEKLCRDVQGCISSFGTELEVEAGNPSQHSIARAMQKKTLLIYATGLFRSQLAAAQAVSLKASRVAVLPEQDRKYDDSNITSDVDSLSDDGSEVAERLDCERETMEKHLLGSEAYGLFLQRLLDIAHETYRYRIEIALDRSAIDETGLKYGDTSLHELTRQLAWVPPQTLRFVEDSYSDWIKVFMEQVLGEQCEWWPLEPPSRLLRTGYCLLYWQSVSDPSSPALPCKTPFIKSQEALRNTLLRSDSAGKKAGTGVFFRDGATLDHMQLIFNISVIGYCRLLDRRSRQRSRIGSNSQYWYEQAREKSSPKIFRYRRSIKGQASACNR